MLIDDLLRQHRSRAQKPPSRSSTCSPISTACPSESAKTEFYQHDAQLVQPHDPRRQPAGDGLAWPSAKACAARCSASTSTRPTASSSTRNFQWSTTSRDVKDGNADHITREPEQVKAFRDTWRDGIHSLSDLSARPADRGAGFADRFSGSIFVQIGDENVHRVRAVMDEVFGEENFIVSIITFKKTAGSGRTTICQVC